MSARARHLDAVRLVARQEGWESKPRTGTDRWLGWVGGALRCVGLGGVILGEFGVGMGLLSGSRVGSDGDWVSVWGNLKHNVGRVRSDGYWVSFGRVGVYSTYVRSGQRDIG